MLCCYSRFIEALAEEIDCIAQGPLGESYLRETYGGYGQGLAGWRGDGNWVRFVKAAFGFWGLAVGRAELGSFRKSSFWLLAIGCWPGGIGFVLRIWAGKAGETPAVREIGFVLRNWAGKAGETPAVREIGFVSLKAVFSI